MACPVVSIVINNYNYGRFLPEAIASALAQTYPQTEVVVVDDGSTDNSRDVIKQHAGRIIPVLKENGGQASAFNHGLRASRGQIVVFLDADDVLLSDAARQLVSGFEDPKVVKVHWPLLVVDEQRKPTGELRPHQELEEGDFNEAVLQGGPWVTPSPPTSGNAWARTFLEQVFPVPEQDYRICADSYLIALALAYGKVKKIIEPQGLYRRHGLNQYGGSPFADKLRRDLEIYDLLCNALRAFLNKRGIAIDTEQWKRNSWPHRLHRATSEVSALIPRGAMVIVIDDDVWGGALAACGYRQLPFLERDGIYWGPPPDCDAAVAELARLRQSGARFVVVGWPSFWWLDHYIEFNRHLRSHSRLMKANELFVAFDLT